MIRALKEILAEAREVFRDAIGGYPMRKQGELHDAPALIAQSVEYRGVWVEDDGSTITVVTPVCLCLYLDTKGRFWMAAHAWDFLRVPVERWRVEEWMARHYGADKERYPE